MDLTRWKLLSSALQDNDALRLLTLISQGNASDIPMKLYNLRAVLYAYLFDYYQVDHLSIHPLMLYPSSPNYPHEIGIAEKILDEGIKYIEMSVAFTKWDPNTRTGKLGLWIDIVKILCEQGVQSNCMKTDAFAGALCELASDECTLIAIDDERKAKYLKLFHDITPPLPYRSRPLFKRSLDEDSDDDDDEHSYSEEPKMPLREEDNKIKQAAPTPSPTPVMKYDEDSDKELTLEQYFALHIDLPPPILNEPAPCRTIDMVQLDAYLNELMAWNMQMNSDMSSASASSASLITVITFTLVPAEQREFTIDVPSNTLFKVS